MSEWAKLAEQQEAYLGTVPIRSDALARETWIAKYENVDTWFSRLRHFGSDGREIPPLAPDEKEQQCRSV